STPLPVAVRPPLPPPTPATRPTSEKARRRPRPSTAPLCRSLLSPACRCSLTTSATLPDRRRERSAAQHRTVPPLPSCPCPQLAHCREFRRGASPQPPEPVPRRAIR